jgi:hypothetical protein
MNNDYLSVLCALQIDFDKLRSVVEGSLDRNQGIFRGHSCGPPVAEDPWLGSVEEGVKRQRVQGINTENCSRPGQKVQGRKEFLARFLPFPKPKIIVELPSFAPSPALH